QYNYGLIPSKDTSQKFITNFYKVQINNENIYMYKFTQEFQDEELLAIIKQSYQQLSTIFEKKFIIQRPIIISPLNISNDKLLQTKIQFGSKDQKDYMQLSLRKVQQTQLENEKQIKNIFGLLTKTMLQDLRLEKLGKKYFEKTPCIDLKDFKMQILAGYLTSLESYQFNSKLLNIDSCFKVTRKQTLIELIQQQNELTNITNFKGNIIITMYNNKFHRIEQIMPEMTPQDNFQDQKGNVITYEDYYFKQYGIQNINPKQPLIKCIKLIGKTKKPFEYYLIPSLCYVTGIFLFIKKYINRLTNQQKSDFHLMKKLAETTKPNAQIRQNQQLKFVKQLRTDCDRRMKDWNININEIPEKINFKQLSPGNLLMDQTPNCKKAFNVLNCNLDRDTQTKMFEQPALKKWAIFYYKDDQQIFNKLTNMFQECLKFCQYPCQAPFSVKVDENTANGWINVLKSSPDDAQMCVILLRGKKKSGQFYDQIKLFLTNQKPIPSQVILTSTASNDKGLRTVVNKLLVQICSKTGGIPWVMSDMPFQDQPTMIVGIDVYHNISGKQQSILGFVATTNVHFTKYYSSSVMMQQGQEISQYLQQIYVNALKQFNKFNGIYPKRVIVFRDGISQGQFKVIQEIEMPQLNQAIKQIQECGDIKFCIISVNKVNYLFILYKKKICQNPPQGALIENLITKGDHDFYIVSQKAYQGTSSPTHYYIVYNDIIPFELQKLEFREYIQFKRELQLLAFKSTFLYYNYSGAIKEPSAVRYAHVLCNFVGQKYNPSVPNSLIQAHQQYDNLQSLYFI
ncbi:paz and PIWI domain protein, partial [Ichthyophthirius multifiliis]